MSEVCKGLRYFVMRVLLQGSNSYKLSSNMGRAISSLILVLKYVDSTMFNHYELFECLGMFCLMLKPHPPADIALGTNMPLGCFPP